MGEETGKSASIEEERKTQERGVEERKTEERGSKLLRCGAQTPSHGLRRDKIGKCVQIFFDEGRNWASAPHSVGVYSHAALFHKWRTVGALLAAPSNLRPPSFALQVSACA